MASLIILFISLLIGLGLQRVKTLPENAHSVLGSLVLYVPLPALCLLTLPDLEWNASLLSLGLVAWIIFFAAFGLFTFLGRTFGWPRELVACLTLTSGFCNSAFVGFPVINALFGEAALKNAIFLDQAGTFLVTSTFGVWMAITYSSGTMNKRMILKRVFQFPPFLAFILGIGLGCMHLRPEGPLREVLEKIALLLTPMALISVGLQLKWKELKFEKKYLSIGLSFKLILAPLLIFIFFQFAGVDKNTFQVAVMESAMAPMITSSILASSHGLRPRLAGMMVGIGVPLSGLTLALWYSFIV
jgi:predicted permease